MRNNKHIPILWVSLLILCVAPAYAQETSGYCGRQSAYNVDSTNLQWNFSAADSLLTITGTGRMKDYDMDTRAPWYDLREGIKRVVIDDGVTTIGTYAMCYNNSVDSVHFGSGLERIRESAFIECDKLRSVYLQGNVTNIEPYAFAYIDSLRVVDIGTSPATIEYWAFMYCYNVTTIRFSNVQQVHWQSFVECHSLVNLDLGTALVSIGSYAFGGCSSLRKLYIPASVNDIQSGAFANSSSLDTIIVAPANTVFNSNGNCNAIMRTSDNMLITGCRNTVIPATTKGIESQAFEGCIGLQTATLPDGITYIGSNAFSNCINLHTINFPNSINSVGCYPFYYCTALTAPVYNDMIFAFLPLNYKGAYVMPASIKQMCCGAFYDCDSVTNITLSDSLTSLPENSFNNCASLTSLVIPDAVTTIYHYAFYNCRSMTSITIPANFKEFGQYVFDGCSSLKHVIWNAKDARVNWFFYNYPHETIVNEIQSYHPFYNVRKQITSFTLGDSVQVVPRYLCYEMENISSLSFGCEADSIEAHAFDGCTGITSVEWNVRNGKDPATYGSSPFYPVKDKVTTFSFGDSVQHIPAYLCHGMSKLSRLYIPKKVSSIGGYAFRDLNRLDSIYVHDDNLYYDSRNHCNALIESAYNRLILGCYKTQIPEDIVSIGACAFRNVRKLTAALIPETVTNIEEEAFNGCTDLDTVALPSTLTAINDYTFQDCSSLDTIALPQTLEFIGIRAFSNCTGLPNITLPASMDYIDQFAFSRCSNMEYITCLAVEPPTIRSTTFDYTSCPVYVPCTSLDAYRSAPVWSDYGTRVFGTFDYKLTVRPNDYFFGWDTIIQLPSCEDNAIVYANPNAGYEFVEWQDSLGNTLSAEQMYEFYVDEDMTVIAVFRERQQGFDNIDAQTAVWVKEHKVLLRTNIDAEARLYDITGREVDACDVTADVTAALQAPSAGVYVVVTGGRQQKVIVQ